MANALKESTALFGANSVFIEEMYDRYLVNPQSVDQTWQDFFKTLLDDTTNALKANKGASWSPRQTKIVGVLDPSGAPTKGKKEAANQSVDVTQACADSIKALMIIRAYKVRGHLLAQLDPLQIDQRATHPDLEPATYGFSLTDYDRKIYVAGAFGYEFLTLNELLGILQHIYSQHVGVEFMHIQSLEQRDWIAGRIEAFGQSDFLTPDEKRKLLNNLVHLEVFEQFLHVKYPGAKRFSVEGGEAAVAAAEVVIERAAELGVEEIVIGMPHRGRLNMLTKVMGKGYDAMLSEFQGNLAHPESMNISGDVKYHLGTSSDRKFANGKTVHLSLTANPSHLEAVNPVVSGKVRAKQDQRGDTERSRVMGMLLHGDAAFAGQGVVEESIALTDLHGYTSGGTMHIIVNNQIGFTTNPRNARSSPYPSDVAKLVQAPIFHINGDDPEVVARISKIAMDYRQTFKNDVVLDVVCYRRYGHNEGDEPFFTQPVMYTKIKGHKTPMEVYAERLVAEGVVTREEFQEMVRSFRTFLDEKLEASKQYAPNKADWLEGKWKGFKQADDIHIQPKTGIKSSVLKSIGKELSKTDLPIVAHSKIERLIETKGEMFKSGKGFDWATAEALAFGSLLLDGHPVRLSGQDCTRGTFSHRHSAYFDQTNETRYYPLRNLNDKQATFEVIDSNLSEYAVLGFEYGYSLAEPNGLVLWEAQFGDFANGAQIMIDQFIVSGEIKWLRMSGLVMLLPHGYEGQGPEHSSARLERFLQLCAEDNIQVANCTTPANYFHILRRQMARKYRKPLVIMSPKSLLRHRLAVSSVDEMAEGTSFRPIIGETEKLVAASKVRKVVICSGKVYYDLYEERQKRKLDDVAIIRVEQLYPFPAEMLANELKQYKQAEVIWCQEEPYNMGSWHFVDRRIEDILAKLGVASKRPRFVGRKEAASPAVGYLKVHNKEQAALIEEALR